MKLQLAVEDTKHLNPKPHQHNSHRRVQLDRLTIYNFHPIYPTDNQVLKSLGCWSYPRMWDSLPSIIHVE
ncbi:hypothetical protein [Shimazuella alba]|uniref:Uncharacterized protein n=1 Tax=Shimazuella alba TaxID=2690964 RepID=A0A6I4VW15_9BACL|nr:hypothetical protein [Shimazuella alba]MXQ54050.1 hypothetical protein [Shimazuella alba]